MKKLPLAVAILIAAVAVSCTRGEYEGAFVPEIPNGGGDGPHVLFEPNAKPVPLIPFPNDIMTRYSPGTKTHKRLNIPTDADSALETKLRRLMNTLDGFGTFGPITVSFDSEIDLATVGPNSVIVAVADPESPHFGELAIIDYSGESYPVNLKVPTKVFAVDPKSGYDNLVFAPDNPQRNYEAETNTLILKPYVPLRQSTRYAVILTKSLRDPAGRPVQPPESFDYAYIPSQFEELKPILKHLFDSRIISPDDIAFAWVFTTQSTTHDLEVIRDGLKYGEGPLARLYREYPPVLSTVNELSTETDGDNNPFTFRAYQVEELFRWFWSLIPGFDQVFPVDAWSDQSQVDYYVAGTFLTPYFIRDDDVFHLDSWDGVAEYSPEVVPFLCAIPKPTPENGFAQPPYPVVIFQHGYQRNRLDLTTLANTFAKHGFATIGIDAPEHGPEKAVAYYATLLDTYIDPPPDTAFEQALVLPARLLLATYYPSSQPFAISCREVVDYLLTNTLIAVLLRGRARDYDGDGVPDPGANFFTADAFHTRDIIRQSAIDLMQLVRVVQNFGVDANSNGAIDVIEGDFNMDGIPDLGGPGNPVFYMGTSMGGIIGSVFLAIEPDVVVGTVNVPGGGLTDLVLRSTLMPVAERVFGLVLGPAVCGHKGEGTRYVLGWDRSPKAFGFGELNVPEGGTVYLLNTRTAKRKKAAFDADGNFLVSIAADKGDRLVIQSFDADGNLFDETEFQAEHEGLGLDRNTPGFRSFIDLAQMAIDGGDPVNYAPHWFAEPLPRMPEKKVLVTVNICDWIVPAATGVYLARAAGLVSPERNRRLLDLGVFHGECDITYEEANVPEESKSLHGFRLHPGGNHAYLYWPSFWDETATKYTFAVREQAAIFFSTYGEVIEDDLDSLLDGVPLK